MNLLLDTHALIWWDNDELPAPVVRRIQRAERVFVSAVSAWEVAIKSALGKMTAKAAMADVLKDYGFCELPVHIRHAEMLRSLPSHHRDPFDRLLIAQAMVEDLVIVSVDRAFKRYKVAIVWD